MSTEETVFEKLKRLTGMEDHIELQKIMVTVFEDYQEYCKEFLPKPLYLTMIENINLYVVYLITTGQALA